MNTLFENMDNILQDFGIPTTSPINHPTLTGQNNSLLQELLTGDRLDRRDSLRLEIGAWNSRVSEVRDWLEVKSIHLCQRPITYMNKRGEPIRVNEYWLEKEDILKLKTI